ncbi:hypothetical protein QA640_23500 [Bradyrhizobium sp. CB82]|uniref:hypothetical protein n=1 Tax=Bradyrhizobium sp. CB82 TaxID=3039159 RepID=UPI0024B26653|nr:hypothetical protein [Bradyrhizobium sp. CB82]WFU37449.1 hypothetical protein QA640_23500 [Bradyrhizobium sp. CB82]
MAEYVIREVGLHQWLVFADRKCIAFCAAENEAVKAMNEHSARSRRPPNSMYVEPGQSPPVRAGEV